MPIMKWMAARWLMLLFCLALLLLILPSAASAGGSTIFVPPPNGVDDTANIQAALDACVAKGADCTVQLAAGIYHTRQIVEYNFNGTFRGADTDSTIIDALYPLPVSLCLL
jgi:pectin methylesterase-like acyl-CoA thioesterase